MRQRIVERIRRKLVARGYPRFQMSLLVIVTGAVGFLCSYLLLRLGVEQIWLRYLLALSGAYLAFLGLLRLWLHTKGRDYADAPDLAQVIDFAPQGGRLAPQYQGGGGEFGGGGASGAYEDASSAGKSIEWPSIADAADGADEFAIPIAVIVFVASILLVAFSLVYSAPVLFAELVLDGVLAASLFRRLRRLETNYWLHTAIRRTAPAFAVTGVILVAGGWLLSVYAPAARTLGEALRSL